MPRHIFIYRSHISGWVTCRRIFEGADDTERLSALSRSKRSVCFGARFAFHATMYRQTMLRALNYLNRYYRWKPCHISSAAISFEDLWSKVFEELASSIFGQYREINRGGDDFKADALILHFILKFLADEARDFKFLLISSREWGDASSTRSDHMAMRYWPYVISAMVIMVASEGNKMRRGAGHMK